MLISISELISQSWHNYLKTWTKFLPLLGILFLLTTFRYLSGFLSLYIESKTNLSELSVDIVLFLLLIAFFFLWTWASIAIIRLTGQLRNNLPSEDTKSNFSQSKKYIIPSLLISLLVGLIIGFGTILFLIPGIIFFVWFYFSNYTVVFEDKKMEAFKTSKDLAVGRWFSMAFRVVLPKILYLFVMLVIIYLITTITNLIFDPSETSLKLFNGFTKDIITVLTIPLFVWSDVLLYFSAKENPSQLVTPIQK